MRDLRRNTTVLAEEGGKLLGYSSLHHGQAAGPAIRAKSACGWRRASAAVGWAGSSSTQDRPPGLSSQQ